MKKPRVRVSDHAVLRYLERAGGFDIERLRREIGRRVEDAVAASASGVSVGGVNFRIKEDEHGPVVTTVIRDEWLLHNHQRSEGEG